MRAAYYDLLFAQHKQLILEQSSALFDNALQASQLRLKAGDIAPNELARLRVDAGPVSYTHLTLPTNREV